MKNIFKKISIIILFICFTFVFLYKVTNYSVNGATAPYTITCNPGEDSSSMMNINFHTDLGLTDGKVVYTKKSDSNWENALETKATGTNCDIFDGISSKSSSGANIVEEAKFIDWNATLTGLDKDTDYMYKVGCEEMSEVRYFKTAGATDFSFAWISDFHSYTPIAGRLTNAMSMINTLIKFDSSTDFILSTGDDIAWGGSYSFWKRFYEEENVKNYMWATTIGNHDYMDRTSTKSSTAFFKVVKNNPANGYQGEEGVSYWFIYGNTLFFFLDNETLNNTTAPLAIEWMREVIKSHPTQYIIVSEHYQWFNGISGATNTGFTRFNKFFDEVGVDLAIAGNNHIYLRTKSLYNGKASTDQLHGTVYIQAPSSDNDRGQDMNEVLTYNQDIIEYRYTEGTKTVAGINVKINKDRIQVTLLNRSGTVLDYTTIYPKRNDFDMSGFDYNSFMNDFVFRQSSYVNNEIIVQMSDVALDYIDKMKIYDSDGKIVVDSQIKSKKNLRTIISNLELNKIQKFKVEFYYKDLSIKKVDFEIPLYEKNDDLILNVKVEDKKFTFNWQTNNDLITKYKIYTNSELYMDSTDTSISINKKIISEGDIITIKGLASDNTILSEVNYKYNVYGDCNCDGVINDDDVKTMQNYLMDNTTTECIQRLSDCNHDGVIDLIDATLLKMLNDNIIEKLSDVTYNVTFDFGSLGTETITVLEGATPVSKKATEMNNFAGFNTKVTPAYSDTTYYAIFETLPRLFSISGINTAKINTTEKYTVIVSPYDASSSCTWTSSDTEVATVNEFGEVTFISTGEVTIYATSKAIETVVAKIVIKVNE